MLVPSNSLATLRNVLRNLKRPVSECELAGGDYPGQEIVSIYLIKIKITTKFFNFIAKNTLTIS